MSFAWSYSVLDMHRTCPKKYYHIKVLKDAKDDDSSFSADGKAIHDAMFKRVIHGQPLPIEMRPFEKRAAAYAMLPGERRGELKLALTQALEPTDFFAKNVWVRAILDLLVINGKRAILVDWKTGKPKDDFEQLKLAAAVVSRYLPEIEDFTLVYEWLRHNKSSPLTMKKEHMRAVWMDSYEMVKEIEAARKTTSFPARQSPLCNWCPVVQCPHNQKQKKPRGDGQ